MSSTLTRFTVEEYRAATVEGDRKQLVDGAIVLFEPRFRHQLIQERLLFALGGWARSPHGHGLVLGPTDIAIDEHNAFGPDVSWFADTDYRPPAGETYADRLPDLCAEIRSPSTWRYDIGAKKSAYERGGLPELWLVDDVAEVVLAYRRSAPGAPAFDVALEVEAGDELASPVLPGFTLSLAELFAA